MDHIPELQGDAWNSPPYKAVSVIDVGGGVGVYYPLVKKELDTLRTAANYAVVDGEKNCELGSAYFGSDRGIRFFDYRKNDLEEAVALCAKSCVVNLSSTLHDMLDWKEFLRGIFRRKYAGYLHQ